jgi:hypothetical protein
VKTSLNGDAYWSSAVSGCRPRAASIVGRQLRLAGQRVAQAHLPRLDPSAQLVGDRDVVGVVQPTGR